MLSLNTTARGEAQRLLMRDQLRPELRSDQFGIHSRRECRVRGRNKVDRHPAARFIYRLTPAGNNRIPYCICANRCAAAVLLRDIATKYHKPFEASRYS
jgi:hypothetical protein